MSRRRKRRPGPAPSPATWSRRLYVMLATRDIGRLKFLLEGYDHLAYITVLDRHAAAVQVVFSPDQEREARAALQDVGRTVPMRVIDMARTAHSDTPEALP